MVTSEYIFIHRVSPEKGTTEWYYGRKFGWWLGLLPYRWVLQYKKELAHNLARDLMTVPTTFRDWTRIKDAKDAEQHNEKLLQELQ